MRDAVAMSKPELAGKKEGRDRIVFRLDLPCTLPGTQQAVAVGLGSPPLQHALRLCHGDAYGMSGKVGAPAAEGKGRRAWAQSFG